MYLLLLRTQMRTRLQKTIAIDRTKIKKALIISAVAGNVDGQPLSFKLHELFAREGATSNAPLVESNIVGACEVQRNDFLYKALRSIQYDCIRMFPSVPFVTQKRSVSSSTSYL